MLRPPQAEIVFAIVEMLSFLILSCFLLVSKMDSYKLNTNYTAKSFNFRQRFLVLHYTAIDLPTSLKVLTGDRVSSHYLVPPGPIDGKRQIYSLVPEDLRAWTQGVSFWRGRNNLNDQGIGVEIVNLGFTDDDKGVRSWYPFPPHQVESVIQLSKDIIKRYDIEPTNVFGHADCSPGRKVDPGPMFPWKQLYDNGIGAWPDDADVTHFMQTSPTNIDILDFQQDLNKYGYNVNTDGQCTSQTTNAVVSFQMHFRQSKFDGVIDKETVAILKALIKKYR